MNCGMGFHCKPGSPPFSYALAVFQACSLSISRICARVFSQMKRIPMASFRHAAAPNSSALVNGLASNRGLTSIPLGPCLPTDFSVNPYRHTSPAAGGTAGRSLRLACLKDRFRPAWGGVCEGVRKRSFHRCKLYKGLWRKRIVSLMGTPTGNDERVHSNLSGDPGQTNCAPIPLSLVIFLRNWQNPAALGRGVSLRRNKRGTIANPDRMG
jgi:hypothetical protein